MLHYGEDSQEFERLAWEMGNVIRFSAFLNAANAGLSVDFDSVIEKSEYKAIGLVKLWREIKEAG